MQFLKSLKTASYQDLIDFNVVDAQDEHIGTLHSLWSDQASGHIEFLGVKTGWLFGKNHVVPVTETQVDAAGKLVKLPYPAAFIKNAPSMDADSEINEAQEQKIFSYYQSFADPSTASTVSDAPCPDIAAANESSDMDRALGATAVRSGRLRRTCGNVKALTPELSSAPGTGLAGGGDVNPDPITGEPGAHPVGTGIGAASGAVTGAAMGVAGGPVGAVIGGVAGAVVGGLIGKGVEEYFDPTAEAAYWRENYSRSTAYDPALSFEDLAPAYRAGYEGFALLVKEGRTGEFSTVEPELQRDYQRTSGQTGLAWEKARHAARDAYERVRADASSRSH